jgi:hypothetical protein
MQGVSDEDLATTRKVLLKVLENLAQEEAQMDKRPSGH